MTKQFCLKQNDSLAFVAKAFKAMNNNSQNNNVLEQM